MSETTWNAYKDFTNRAVVASYIILLVYCEKMEDNTAEVEAPVPAEPKQSGPQKRERTEKQKAVWQKAIQTRQSNLENALYTRLKERFEADELEKLRKLQVIKDGDQQLNVFTGRNQTMKGSTKPRHSKKAKHEKTESDDSMSEQDPSESESESEADDTPSKNTRSRRKKSSKRPGKSQRKYDVQMNEEEDLESQQPAYQYTEDPSLARERHFLRMLGY